MAGIFDGRVAIVTGAASGIGRATSIAFAREGAAVIVADVTEDGGQQTVDRIRDTGGEASFVHADVTNADDVAALVKAALSAYGRLDYAHNNAGIEGASADLLSYPDEMFDRVINVNLKGVWLCMKEELRHMLAQGGGAIVNTASVAGLRGAATLPAYAASKFGVVGLTKSAAQTYSRRGVRINCVCPGVIETAMVARLNEVTGGQFSARTVTSHPIGHSGQPEEIAAAVTWLCSDAASFVTGVAFPVDGGMTA